MTCAECQNFDMRAHPTYARLGMGNCKSGAYSPATFVTASYARECARFVAAPADVVAKRIAFLDRDKSAESR